MNLKEVIVILAVGAGFAVINGIYLFLKHKFKTNGNTNTTPTNSSHR